MAIKIVDCSDVSPSHDAGEQSLPLVYFDFWWFQFPPTQSIYFYNLKCSQTHFLDKVVPQLKLSLSITLNHFTPLAGKLIFPLNNSPAAMPVSRYAPGDGVALTIAVSGADFSDLTGNRIKPADDFHLLVPLITPAEYSDTVEFRSIAIQATLFPNQGIAIGFTQHHALCDARSQLGFIGAWASVNELNSEGRLVEKSNLLPHYDRSRVQEATELSAIAWAEAAAIRPALPLVNYLPLHKLRATFTLTDVQIERLKKLAVIKKPAMGRVSTFVVACAHLWSCLVKSGEEAADDEPEYLTSPVDCRARLQPPLPDNYFGNCLILMGAASTHGRLRGDEGFVAAAEAIADSVGKILRPGGGGGISDYVKHGRREIRSQLMGKRVVWLAGSSRLDHYGADYGWGRAIKYECIHTDHNDGNVNLCKGRDGGVEIGLSLPQAKIDAFAVLFNKYLHFNSNL